MTSTLTTYNTSPTLRFVQPGSPQLIDLYPVPLLTQHFSSASTQDTTQNQPNQPNLPNPANVVRNLMTKSIQEIKETSDQSVNRVGMMSTLRKAFRDFYIKEQTNIFQFLNKPVEDSETISTAHQIMKKFGNQYYNSSRVKIRDLCLDLSCNETVDEMNSLFPSGSYDQWVHQTRILIETWKISVTGLINAEKKLDTQLSIFNETYKKATTVLSLPMNDSYEVMLQSTETYLKQVFDDTKIEASYKEYLYYLKKMVVATDAMNLVRLFVNSSTEPMCPVCMSDTVCCTNIPCGHTFCNACGQKQTITCYICRTNVKDRQKIYFA